MAPENNVRPLAGPHNSDGRTESNLRILYLSTGCSSISKPHMQVHRLWPIETTKGDHIVPVNMVCNNVQPEPSVMTVYIGNR